MRTSNEHGIAMITTLLVLMLISALLVGFTTIVMSDQRYRFIDRDRGQAFYAASGAVEKLTVDLGNTFFSNVAPTGVQLAALIDPAKVPVVQSVTFTAPTAPAPLPGSTLNANSCSGTRSVKQIGGLGYSLTYCADAAGNPTTIQPVSPIKTGPYEGLIALQTPYQIDVTAKTATGGEVHLSRTIESVAIPVFQFGTFSDVDLAFFAGSPFNFGGRVHTNGNLFLSEGGNVATGTCPTTTYLTLSGKVTAVGEVVRQRLQNGVSIDTNPAHNGTVCMATSTSAFRPLDRTEGSVVDGLGVGVVLNDPVWHNASLSAYNSWIRNGRTGAKALNLPLLTVGGTNPDLIRRPPPGEAVANAVLFNERLFSKASLRILLSDTAADINNLPTVTAAAPISLGTTLAANDSNWNLNPPAGIVAPPATVPAGVRAPIARVPGPLPANFTVRTQQDVGTWGPTGSPLKVRNLPPSFLIPDLIVTKGATVRNVRCTGRITSPTISFTGCVDAVTGLPFLTAMNAPATVTTAANAVNSTTPTATTTANWAIASTTITVDDNSDFAQGWFFVTANGATAQTLVQCTGYDNSVPASPTLLNCAAWNANAIPPVVYASNANPRLNDATPIYTDSLSAAQTSALGGFIKIERQDANGVWWDVTTEVLSYGIAGPNWDGSPCADPTPAAILRLQRLRDNGGATLAAPNLNGGGCNYAGSTNASDYWPNSLFDAREALFRDVAPADGDVRLGGVMYYVGLDVANLARWFTATAPYNCGAACTGAASRKDNGGFTVYFSDRRNNRKADGTESGEYGFEDFVNVSNAASGAPDGIMDPGEDVNASGGLPETYGATPHLNGGLVPAVAAWPNMTAPLDVNARPWTPVTSPGYAMVNRAILFRRALKLINGSNITGLGVTGLSVVSENPVYIQGDWNANNAGGAGFTGPSAATAVMADAVTLLSGNWDDGNTYTNPYSATQRDRTTQSWYRVAIIGGKGAAFPWINGTPTDFGTDGGAHNFLRLLEDGSDLNGNAATVNYLGATATFFYSRQAVGTYKYGSGIVYNAPTRAFNFDINFNNPALLPPNTPVFRDMNAVGFSQELRPGK